MKNGQRLAGYGDDATNETARNHRARAFLLILAKNTSNGDGNHVIPSTQRVPFALAPLPAFISSHPRQAPAASFLPPNRKRLGSTTSPFHSHHGRGASDVG